METLPGSPAADRSEKGAGPKLGRRRREEGGSSRLLSASSQPVQQRRQQPKAAGLSSHLRGTEPRPALPVHHDPLAVALLGLLHLGGAARLGADGEVPGGGADGRL